MGRYLSCVEAVERFRELRRESYRVVPRCLRLRWSPKSPVRSQGLFRLHRRARPGQSPRPAHRLHVLLGSLRCPWKKARRRWTRADPFPPAYVGCDSRRAFPDQLVAADWPRTPRPRARRHLPSLPQSKTEPDDLRRRGQTAAWGVGWTDRMRTTAPDCDCCCCRHRLRETNAGKPVIPRAAASRPNRMIFVDVAKTAAWGVGWTDRSWAQRSRPVVQAGRRAFPGDESVVDECDCCSQRLVAIGLRETNAGKPVIPRAAASFLVDPRAGRRWLPVLFSASAVRAVPLLRPPHRSRRRPLSRSRPGRTIARRSLCSNAQAVR